MTEADFDSSRWMEEDQARMPLGLEEQVTILDSLEAAGVAWCSEADFARLIAVARAAQTVNDDLYFDPVLAAGLAPLTTEDSDE